MVVQRSRRAETVAGGLLGLLIVLHLVVNWSWIKTNVVAYGFDPLFHQVTSLAYHDMLRDGLNPRTLFAALTWSDYYPPLVHVVAALAYEVLGVSMDVAAMTNSLYLVLLLVAVYDIGRRLAGPWIGLLSASVVSTFPIVFSMSRYLYVDFALTAMVAVNICLLLRSEGFQRKGTSLLYGLSLGLGMLTKWTFIAFTVVPLLVVVVRSGALRAAGRALGPALRNGRRLLVASLFGLACTAVWFVPNIQATLALPLGFALVPLSWLIWTGTFVFVLSPPERGANLWGALGMGVGVASAWYLTKINFVGTFWLNAYGKTTGRSWAFVPYLDFLYREQLSPLYAVVLILATVALIWHLWRPKGGRTWREKMELGMDWGVLLLWAVVPFLVFSSRVSIVHSRYIMPLLPALGIAIAVGIGRIGARPARLALLALVLPLAVVQFAALSFDAVGRLAQGPFSPEAEGLPLAQGLSIQLPASGRTDAAYGVVPRIMQTIEERREGDRATLGILVNMPQVNGKHFIYLAYDDYPHVQVNELATLGREQPAYPRLFECDWVLVIDPPPHYPRRPDTEETLQRLANSPDDTFHRAYAPAQIYPLPDGQRLILYQRRFQSVEGGDPASYQAAMDRLARTAQPQDALLVLPPEQVYASAHASAADGSLPIYPFPSEARPVSEEDVRVLEELGSQYKRLWVLLGKTQEIDPGGVVATWLAEHYYQADEAWYGDLRLALYAPAAGGESEPAAGLQERSTRWDNGMALQGYRFLDEDVPLGQIARLDTLWQATQSLPERVKVFVHLVDQQGQVVAQRDSEPVAGTRPTTSWQAGKSIADRTGLLLPAGLPAGEYQVVLGVYRPDSGERILACCPETDMVPLAKVQVEGNTAHFQMPGGN